MCMFDVVCLLTAERIGLRCVSVSVDNGGGGTTVCKCDDVCLLIAKRVGLRCVSVSIFVC